MQLAYHPQLLHRLRIGSYGMKDRTSFLFSTNRSFIHSFFFIRSKRITWRKIIQHQHTMASKGGLREFLENHKADGVWTHTSLAGGKYFIGEDAINQFYELYAEAILDQDKQYLTERSTDIGPLRIDFDFIYPPEIKTHLHTQEQVIKFTSEYLKMMGEYLELPESFDVYVMEKRKPTFDSKNNRMKSGIHMVVPSVCSHKFVEQRVRRALVKRMDEFFPGLPLNEPWEKVYDEAVVNRSGPWTMYGSRKNDPNALPYLTAYVLGCSKDEISIKEDIPPISLDLLKTLSLRRDAVDETPMTDEGKKLYDGIKEQPQVRISGGRAVAPGRGRPAVRGEKAGSRGSSPNGRIFVPLDHERKEYLKKHVMNLDTSRCESYEQWVQVAICLHNIHPDLLDVFLDFSSQDEKKYNEADCIQKWNGLTFRNDGDRLGEPTLRYWSREDNREGYDEIEAGNVDRLVLAACSQTEHDAAAVIHAKFRDNYVCSDFRNSVWYRWSGHIWKENDSGVDLLLKLSKQIAKIFFDRMAITTAEMNNRGLTECAADGKGDCGVCEYCKLDLQRNGLNKVFLNLKKTSFKTNIMKECKELFFDEDFTKKVDANKDLIAFNNGVFDLVKMELRDGKPQDYISFSTEIDYDTEKKYYDFEVWPAIDTFIKQVLPDEEVRDYFLKHLATCLIGGNPAQKFHILTGSGSNGKSMIMNLLSKSMGDYACTVPISLFTQKRKGSGNAAPEVIRLKGRRFVTMQEPDEAIALNTGLMKEITSGEKMYARDLFKSGCEFEVLAKFHLACNDKPKINTTDGGTWRRLMVINFISKFVVKPVAPNEFPLDESIQNSVNSKEWATAFLNYMVHILKEEKGLRKLAAPAKVMEYTSDYRNENDGIARFIAEKISPLEEGDEPVSVDKATLKRVFKQWKDESEQKSLAPADLEKRIIGLYGVYPKKGWVNFKLEV
jgi:P4 family phage/plasmid primase-like protien